MEYDGVLAGTPVFSEQGNRVAYVALKDDVWRLFVNGEEQRAYANPVAEYSVRFTPNGMLTVAMIRRGERFALAVGDAVSHFEQAWHAVAGEAEVQLKR